MRLYNEEPLDQEIEGYYPTKKSYNMQMIEESGVVESLVMGLTLVEDQLEIKLRIIQTLQFLSMSSVMNCNLMLNAQAANRICHCLNAPDPSGQLLFRSAEILWNLLENGSKKEVINQLSNFECIMALKETFMNQALHGYRHYDKQLRNDLLVLATLVAESPLAPFIETGFAKHLIMFAGFPEVKSFNPLLSNFKLTTSHEDFEMKKLLFNMMVALTNDLGSVQLLSEGQVLLALFHYVKPNVKSKIREWSPAQFEELQLHAMVCLTLVAPLMVDDYMECQGNTRLLLLLDCCVGQDPCIGKGNLFHGASGSGNKQVQMYYCLRLLRSMSSLGEEIVNQNLSDQGAIQQLLENKTLISMQTDILIILSAICENDIHRKELFGADGVEVLIMLLKMDPVKFYSGLGHNRLVLASVDCVWCCIIGCYTTEDIFLEKEGIFFLLDLLENMQNLILGVLLEFCDNPKTPLHIHVWRGAKNLTADSLLLKLWRQDEKEMKVKRDELGRIVDAKKPLIGIIQEQQGIVSLPAKTQSAAVIDVSENLRAKIYSIFCKLGFQDLSLCERDYITLDIIQRYLDFKVAEVWIEIERELKQENVHPIASDTDIIHKIIKHVENVSRTVAYQQTELLQKEYNDSIMNEMQMYKEVSDRVLLLKMFLQEAKRVQDEALKASRIEVKNENATFHQPEILNLNTTVSNSQASLWQLVIS
uniref:Cilia and flagella associated protein 69 n=1 Tax=Callorhinchus milii TaxID=7868 RepID=A0A4W3JM40_CALMI